MRGQKIPTQVKERVSKLFIAYEIAGAKDIVRFLRSGIWCNIINTSLTRIIISSNTAFKSPGIKIAFKSEWDLFELCVRKRE